MSKDELSDLEKLNFNILNDNLGFDDLESKDSIKNNDTNEQFVESLEQLNSLENDNLNDIVDKRVDTDIFSKEEIVSNEIEQDLNNNLEQEKDLPKLDDILLSKKPQSTEQIDTQTKQSYLVASAALLVLFILTIVVIRLITPQHENKTKSLVKDVEIKDEVILDDSEIEKQYQSIVAKKLKIKEIKEPDSVPDEKTILKELDETPDLSLQKKLHKKKNIEKQTIKKDNVIKHKLVVKTKIKSNKIKNSKPKKVFIHKKIVKVKHSKPDVSSKYYQPVKKINKIKENNKKDKRMVFPSKKSSKTVLSYENRFKNLYSIPTTEYYIQVAAFSTIPPKEILSKIRRNHFRFRIYQTSIKGKPISKLLIGPYRSRGKELKHDLKIVKAKIVKGAFVYKSTNKR